MWEAINLLSIDFSYIFALDLIIDFILKLCVHNINWNFLIYIIKIFMYVIFIDFFNKLYSTCRRSHNFIDRERDILG